MSHEQAGLPSARGAGTRPGDGGFFCSELAELPVVLTTGIYLEMPSFEGAVCLLRKPFAREELLRILHALTHHCPRTPSGVGCCQVA
ncbi:MAG: hypothetical protein JXB05_19220 [Myxococcaceae bacterium]|nr:hypothetical protein [Myxococcaceae bacterium]